MHIWEFYFLFLISFECLYPLKNLHKNLGKITLISIWMNDIDSNTNSMDIQQFCHLEVLTKYENLTSTTIYHTLVGFPIYCWWCRRLIVTMHSPSTLYRSNIHPNKWGDFRSICHCLYTLHMCANPAVDIAWLEWRARPQNPQELLRSVANPGREGDHYGAAHARRDSTRSHQWDQEAI